METKDEKALWELKEPFAEIGPKMHLLLHTGQLLMENGADSDRTVRDMMRAAAYMGIPKDRIHQHVMYTTLMLNVNDETHSYTEFRKCKTHGINMTTLTAVSKLTWRALEKNYSLHDFERHLLRIKNRPRNYPFWLTALGGRRCLRRFLQALRRFMAGFPAHGSLRVPWLLYEETLQSLCIQHLRRHCHHLIRNDNVRLGHAVSDGQHELVSSDFLHPVPRPRHSAHQRRR